MSIQIILSAGALIMKHCPAKNNLSILTGGGFGAVCISLPHHESIPTCPFPVRGEGILLNPDRCVYESKNCGGLKDNVLKFTLSHCSLSQVNSL